MSEELEFQSPQVSRRRLLQTASGAAVIGCVGVNAVTPVAADPGTHEWTFETGDVVRSSPTVVDGTVFVGSHDDNLYAIDAETGEEEWAFETGDEVESSPMVVDGTVFVGSRDGNLYAVNAGVAGSSEGSRSILGTLGHHDEWQHSDQTIRGEDDQSEADEDDQSEADEDDQSEADEDEHIEVIDDSTPGFGLGSGIAALGASGNMLKHRLTDKTER